MQALNTDESTDALREDVQATIDFINENILNDVEGLRPGKVQALKDAVQAAQDVVNDPTATADELQAANKAMTKAAQELWEIVTKAELEALIEAANGYLDGDYTAESLEALQAVITAVFLWYLARFSGISLRMRIPFLPGKELDAGIFTIPFLAFVILGTVNGVNFTDGLDGLAASVTILNAVFFSVASIGLGNGVSPSPLAVIGSLLGFLVFNVFPARVFMGDTGSLALGGFVSGMACFLRLPLFLPLVGFIYMMEILSVILQVSFFKLTKGKRIFKMTPIHHHFELMGWSETQIVTVFATITAILCLIALMGL